MSEQELYEIARKRVLRRNRRWTFWTLDLFVLIISLVALIVSNGNMLFVAGFLTWGAIFTTHTIILAFAESTEGSIENEVVKLRKAYEREYEKPKRLELGEDGELTEADDLEHDDAQRSRNPARS